MEKNTMTDADHRGLDKLINTALEGYKTGQLSREDAMSGLVHVVSAIDKGNIGEARQWFENPDRLKRD